MRTDVFRWGGLSAVALGLLFAGALLLGFAMGIDIYTDDEADELLRDIDAHGAEFVCWSILNAATSLLLIPVVTALYYTVREPSRPFFAMVAAAFGLSAALSAVGYGFGPVLWDIAGKYVDADGAAQEALLHDGENMQSMLLMFSGMAMTPFALAMLGVSLLSRRAGFFPAWLDWPAVLVAAIGTVPLVGFIVLVPGRIAWLLLVGVILVNRSRAEQASSARAQASAMPA